MRHYFILGCLALALCSVRAQTGTPIVVQAIPAANAPVAAQAAPAAGSTSLDAAIQALRATKTANDDVLAKQAATLLQLEEMEKAAEQIKVYSKRG